MKVIYRGRGRGRRLQTWDNNAMPAAWQLQFAGAASWRSFGVVADGVTDNTAALNALPTGIPLIGDGLGAVLFTGHWNLQSSLLLWVQTQMISTINLTNATAAITQVDPTTALTSVAIYGLTVRKGDISQLGRMVLVYVNGLTLYSFDIGTNNGALHIRGSDQEIAYGSVYNSALNSGGGRVGIRHYGNAPKVATTGRKPANVWVHNCNFTSGDGAYQVSQTDQGPFANVAADDYIFENNVGLSTSGPLILNGQADRVGNTFNVACTNIIYRNMSGQGTRRCINIQNADNPTADMTDITLTDIQVDASLDQDPSSSVIVNGADTSNVRRCNLTRVNVTAPFIQGFRAQGNVFDSSYIQSTITAPRSATAGYNIQIRETTNFLFDTLNVDAAFGGFQIGLTGHTAASPTIQNCTITDVADQKGGVLMQDVNLAVNSNNVISGAIGSIASKGYIMTAAGATPGTTNCSVTGGDVCGCTNTPVNIFIAGQSNTISGVACAPNKP